jgi:4'-phosphopantetheinyl transferase
VSLANASRVLYAGAELEAPVRASHRASLAGEAHIWIADLDAPEARAAPSVLTSDELARAARFHFERDRRRFVAGRALLRRLLGGYLGSAASEITFVYGARGKPSLGGWAAGSALRFNASHTHGVAMFALARDRELGVDIERQPAPDDGEAVARHFFAPNEIARLARVNAAERPASFLRCWTRKEAYIKARGDGLSLPLDSFDVSLEPDAPAALLETRHDDADVHRWSMIDLSRHVPGHIAALAIAGDRPPAVRIARFRGSQATLV